MSNFITVADGEYVFSDGHSSTVRRANIVGPTSGRVRAISNRPTRIFGFGMLPAGWAALMGSHGEKLTDRAIDVAVGRLRRALGDDGADPRFVRTVWGVGYVLVDGGAA